MNVGILLNRQPSVNYGSSQCGLIPQSATADESQRRFYFAILQGTADASVALRRRTFWKRTSKHIAATFQLCSTCV